LLPGVAGAVGEYNAGEREVLKLIADFFLLFEGREMPRVAAAGSDVAAGPLTAGAQDTGES
jgi:hypothetical protein